MRDRKLGFLEEDDDLETGKDHAEAKTQKELSPIPSQDASTRTPVVVPLASRTINKTFT